MLGEEQKRLATVAAGASEPSGTMTARSRPWSLRGAVCWLSLLAVAFGALGCREYYYESSAYFSNSTREPVKVRVQKLVADVDCARVTGRSAELLAHRALFGDAITYEVAAGEALPLDLDDNDFSSPQQERCAALVQVLGFADQLVFWGNASSIETETKLAEGSDPRFLAQSLTLEGYGNVRGLAPGERLEVTPLPPLATGMAAVTDAPAALGWSGAPRTGSNLVLLRSETLPDGCRSLVFGKDLDTSWPLFLCAPAWSFPFEVGDELSVFFEELKPPTNAYGYSSAAGEALRARHLVISGGGFKLEIWLDASQPQVAAVGTAIGRGAPGKNTACGAYVEPASVELPAAKLVLMPGDDVEGQVAGHRLRVFLGRADDVLVAPDACAPEYASRGVRFDLLILDLSDVKMEGLP